MKHISLTKKDINFAKIYKDLTKKSINFAKKKRFVERMKFNQNRNTTFGTIV
jgi:hypothetical protein